ncbi:uncharacterized protein BROUX77_000987 [Berkeleyomyces rouxiae]|uniref:uncharacterized protein n=1 Tax=Berkeleyomyces rouxiae TaxID=2035830 RepID=UPI003B7CE9B3
MLDTYDMPCDEKDTLDYEFDVCKSYPLTASEAFEFPLNMPVPDPVLDDLPYHRSSYDDHPTVHEYSRFVDHGFSEEEIQSLEEKHAWVSSADLDLPEPLDEDEGEVKQHTERYYRPVLSLQRPMASWSDHIAALKESIMLRACEYCTQPTIESIQKIVARLDHPLRNLEIDKIQLPSEKDFAIPAIFCQKLLDVLSGSDAPKSRAQLPHFDDTPHQPAFVLYGYSPKSYIAYREFRMTIEDAHQATPIMPFVQVVLNSNPNESFHCDIPLHHRVVAPIRSVEGLNYSALIRVGNIFVPGDCFFTVCVDIDMRKVRIYVSAYSEGDKMYSACLAGFLLPDRAAMQQFYVLFRSIIEWACLERLSMIAHYLGIEPTGVVLDYERFTYWVNKDAGPRIERAIYFPRPEWMSMGMLSDVMRNHWPEGSMGPTSL